jgi:hypothetical protein
MADPDLKAIVDAAHAVETNAEELATLLAGQGAQDASKLFSQCAKAAHEVVQQIPAAPGAEAPPEQDPAATAAASGPAPPQGGGGGRTPYEGASAGLQADVKAKKKG